MLHAKSPPTNVPAKFRDDYADARSGGRTHLGLDVVAPEGSDVLAMFSGRVIRSDWDYYGGWAVITQSAGVRTKRTVQAYYGHLRSKSQLRVGDHVTAGDIIGAIGRTGEGPPGSLIASAAHVHIWVHVSGSPVDPFPIVTASYGKGVAAAAYPATTDPDVQVAYVRLMGNPAYWGVPAHTLMALARRHIQEVRKDRQRE